MTARQESFLRSLLLDVLNEQLPADCALTTFEASEEIKRLKVLQKERDAA
jgi:hypothetical protein